MLRSRAHLGCFVVAAVMGCSEGPASLSDDERPAEWVEFAGLTLQLEPARSLFTEDFAHYRMERGALARVTPRFVRDCYLNGQVVGRNDSKLAVRSCSPDRSDLVGLVMLDGEAFWAEASTLRPLEAPVGRCGVTEPPAPHPVVAPVPGMTTRRSALSSLDPRFIEVLVVEDAALTEARDAGFAAPDVVLNVHTAAVLYDDADLGDRVLPILTAVVDTGGSDPWGVPASSGGEALSGSYLANFNDWLLRSSTLPSHDHAALFTGYELDGLTVGIASVEGACDPAYSGSIVHGLGPGGSVAQTFAHELGHTIGMGHDGDANRCPQSGFVMAWIYVEGQTATEFSTCSLADGSAWLGSGAAWCIDRVSQPAHGGPNCGDGLVEGDEQCDCGPAGCAGRDPCCEQSSCRLKATASCSVIDGCCDPDSCRPFEPSEAVTCRPASSSCDVEEICDGGTHCPIDQFSPSGMECTQGGWQGACFSGACVTRGEICIALSDDYVLDAVPYDSSCDDTCAVMECVSGGACVFTSYAPPDGTPCGSGQQCWQGQCTGSTTLPGSDGCSQPQLDSDADGTRDCDDQCPRDAQRTESPCAGPETPMPNGAPGPDMGQSGGDASDEDIIILEPAGESGCATASHGGSWPLIFVMGVLLHRRLWR